MKRIHKQIIIVLVAAFVILSVGRFFWIRPDGDAVFITEDKGLYGLSDRNGVIVPARYAGVEFLDSAKNYVVLKRKGELFQSDYIFSVFDVPHSEFVFNDTLLFAISRIEKLGLNTYKLVNIDDRYFATLHLPDSNKGRAQIIPYFSDTVISVRDFIIKGSVALSEPTDSTWLKMKNDNPHAYHLFDRISSMSRIKSSPKNDSNFVRAVSYFINTDSYYKGNYELAMSEMESMIETIDKEGINDACCNAEFQRILAGLSLNRTYFKLIDVQPLYEKEYDAWYNLMEAITYLSQLVYFLDDWGNSAAIDYQYCRMDWFIEKQKQLDDELKILLCKDIYYKPNNSLKSKNDIFTVCRSFHKPNLPGYYHPMWKEVYYAFIKWLEVRDTIAMSLPETTSQAYRAYTDIVIDDLYKLIKNLDVKGLTLHAYEKTR